MPQQRILPPFCLHAIPRGGIRCLPDSLFGVFFVKNGKRLAFRQEKFSFPLDKAGALLFKLYSNSDAGRTEFLRQKGRLSIVEKLGIWYSICIREKDGPPLSADPGCGKERG